MITTNYSVNLIPANNILPVAQVLPFFQRVKATFALIAHPVASSANLDDLLAALPSLNARQKCELRSILSKLEPALLDRTLLTLIEKELPLEPVIELLSLGQVRELIRYKQGEIAAVGRSLEEWQKITADMCSYLPEEKDAAFKYAIQKKIASAIESLKNTFHVIFDPFMAATNMSSEDPPASNAWDAQQRLWYFYDMFEKPLNAFQWLAGALAVVPGLSLAPRIIAGVVLVISFVTLRLLHHWTGATPHSLSGSYPNLVLKAKKGELEPVIGRHKEIQQLVDCLGNLDKHSRHPLLLGPSGAGKTEIVKGLALEIAAGKYPHLKGKALFSINTANMMNIGGGSDSQYASRLEILLKEIRGKEGNVILFFDEVHSLFATGGSTVLGNLSQEFKTLLDNPKIHCFAATTQKEYEETIKKDDALDRRFRPIAVEPLDRDNCHRLISGIAHKDFPGVAVDKEAIELALELTDSIRLSVSQPSKAKDLIIEAIQSINHYQGSEIIQLSELRERLNAAKRDFQTHSDGFSFSAEQEKNLKNLTQLSQEIEKLEKVIKEKNDSLEALKKLRSQRDTTKEKVAKVARMLQKCDLAKERHKAEELIKELLFYGTCLSGALQEEIGIQEDKLTAQGVSVRVNKTLVQKLFDSLK